jgi:dCTP diphosphatase
MKPLDLEKLSNELKVFAEARDWDQFHSVKNLAMALNVEASELLEIFQWVTEEESNKSTLNPKLKEKIEDEVADVFIYLLRIVNKSGLDLDAIVRKKMVKNAEKYPVEKSKGNAKKYTDL